MNHYQILNVPQDASSTDIKRAYYAAVKKHSPDKDPAGFKAVRTAYETLSKPSSRAEYDEYFTKDVSETTRQNLLFARELFAKNQYKQVIEMFKDAKTQDSDSIEIDLMLAEAYLHSGKTGTAENIAKKILSSEPDNTDAISIRARACVERGHVNKAREHFLRWIELDEKDPNAWSQYLNYLRNHEPWMVNEEVNRAFDISAKIFKDNYPLYLMGCGSALKNDLPERACSFMREYIDCLENDADMDREIYAHALEALSRFSSADVLRTDISKIAPMLLQSRYRREEDDEHIKELEVCVTWAALSSDSRIHEIIVDLTTLLMDFDGCEDCENEKQSMELYIIDNLNEIRPSVRELRRDYPELFKLHAKFYTDVLDVKKEEHLMQSAYKRYKALAKRGVFDDSTDSIAFQKPYVRETVKVGRNDPCPCGSGKKYKKCCG